MNGSFWQRPCPNCGKMLSLNTRQEKFKWYQLTPALTLHCPYCRQHLQHSIEKSPTFLMVIIVVYALPFVKALIERYSPLEYHYFFDMLLAIPLIIACYFILKSICWIKAN